ncbi:hypothetical protein BBJ28_00008417 [Nothophytophthora sp. Chile5]|nr:hypothetical protein BBJ28_00008417 [Nothophytophthora sp. Chile5]
MFRLNLLGIDLRVFLFGLAFRCKMLGKNVAASALVAVALGSVLCAGAPKVEIRVVPRPRSADEMMEVLVPIPFREPLPPFQVPLGVLRIHLMTDYSCGMLGPFWGDFPSQECIHEGRATMDGEAYILDFCHLANVTITKKVDEKVGEKVEIELSEDAADLPESTGEDDPTIATLEEPVSIEVAQEDNRPEIPKILGIFRGWHVDPITLNYKYMIFDDGDECGDSGGRYSISVELIPSSNKAAQTRVYGLKKVDECKFTATLLTFVADEERLASDGIHTLGVLDISDPAKSLPVICGKMKCQYGEISARVQDVSKQVMLSSTLFTNMTLESSKTMLESAALVLESSLELFHDIEETQRSLTGLLLGEEELAAKEIAELDAAAKKLEDSVDASAPDQIAGEEVEVTAES